jgi:hypothetical protein
MKLNFILFLAFVGCVTAIGRPKYPLTISPRYATVAVGKTTKTGHAALTIRGGAGPIDPRALARWVTGINLANAIVTYLLPGKIRELYDIPSTPFADSVLFRRHGTALLAFTLPAYCLFFQGSSVETAVGVSTLPFIIELIRSELAEEPEKFGWPKYAQLAPIPLVAMTCYGCLNAKGWANSAMKVYSAWVGITGLLAGLAPELYTKHWNVKPTNTEHHGLQWWGLLMMDLSVYIGCLARGVAPMRALGYSWIPFTVGNACFNLFSDKTKEIGMNRPILFSWMALGIVITATLAFD